MKCLIYNLLDLILLIQGKSKSALNVVLLCLGGICTSEVVLVTDGSSGGDCEVVLLAVVVTMEGVVCARVMVGGGRVGEGVLWE